MVRDDDKVLILRRSGKVISKESPWEWDLPGGHVEKDEALDDALDRSLGRNKFRPRQSNKDLYR